MKKTITIIACIALLGIAAAPVAKATTAQDLMTTLQSQIAALQAKIAELNAQLNSIKQIKTEVKDVTQDVKGTVQLLNQLKPGMTSDEVKKLQEILATDSSIYPSGKITGFFGKLTETAVKKFQEKFCLDQSGTVGPKTFQRINEILKEGVGPTGKVPKGLLNAPGIQKKLCGTVTPDTTDPVISGVEVKNITATTAKVKWSTDENANSKIWYGTTTPVVTTGDPTKSSSSFVDDHSIQLSGLTPNTTYYYVVGSVDRSGNDAFSTEGSFKTLTTDTTAPVISAIQVTNITTTGAKVKWTTDEVANSKIWYGTTTPVVTTGDPTKSSSDYVTSHEIELTGLTAGTTYYYVVGSADGSNNATKATETSFATTAL